MLSIYSYDREPLDCSVPYCHFKYPEKFLEELNLQDGVFWIDVVVILVSVLVPMLGLKSVFVDDVVLVMFRSHC